MSQHLDFTVIKEGTDLILHIIVVLSFDISTAELSVSITRQVVRYILVK